MDLLDRLLAHDAWTTRQLLLQARPLTDAQLDQRFDVDNRSLRECFEHIIDNVEVWTDLMRGLPDGDADITDTTLDGLMRRLGNASRNLAAFARTIARENRWDDVFVDALDNPPRSRTFGGAIAHVITHSMHHRAQAMFMMEQLGIRDHIEGDVLSWEAVAFGWQ